MILIEDSPVFVDTNILIYSNLATSPFHTQALEQLRAFSVQGIELWISRQVIREYLVTITRPRAVTGSATRPQLVAAVRNLISSFQVADETAQVTERLLVLLEQVTINGSQIYDANIVATMQAYGVRRLLTHNTVDFAHYSPFITVLPLIEGTA